jgi:hypothetical protein
MTGVPAARVLNAVARYTPVSTEIFYSPWASRKKCVFHEYVEIENILKPKEK